MLRGLKRKPCAHQDQEIPQRYVRPVFESREQVQVSSDLPQGGRALGAATWATQPVAWAFLEEVAINPTESHWVENPQTEEQLYQRNSHTIKKVLGPTADFLTWGFGKGTESPQKIWLWKPEGFYYRTQTGLEKQTLGGHKKTLCAPGPRRKEGQWPHKKLTHTHTCLWVSRSLRGRCGLAVACCRIWGSECGNTYREPFEGGHHYFPPP